jgi:hypothetical protein
MRHDLHDVSIIAKSLKPDFLCKANRGIYWRLQRYMKQMGTVSRLVERGRHQPQGNAPGPV